MGRKKKPEAEPRFARVEVAVTDGMEGLSSAFGSKPRGARATFTITDGYTVFERTYQLPSPDDVDPSELALIRDHFVLERWRELIENNFPDLWTHPLLGGPPMPDWDPNELSVCDHHVHWTMEPGRVMVLPEPVYGAAVDEDLAERIMGHISDDAVNAEEDIRTSGEQTRLPCKVWDGSCVRSYRLQDLLDRAGRF
jgi:hypothetical protein